eukprot:Hpha_TRINITY_DN16085_c1_g18::TRINITY_DN16085_c1_g18_i1::g.118953::m.118953
MSQYDAKKPEDVETFMSENGFDEECRAFLHEQSIDAVQAVLDGGSFRDARKVMAVLWTRIQQADPTGEWNPDGGGVRKGVVKLWSAAKGYGFLVDEETQEEIFVHNRDIGGRSLVQGGIVRYDLADMTGGKKKGVNISGAVGRRIDLRPGDRPQDDPIEVGKGRKGEIWKGKGGGYEPYRKHRSAGKESAPTTGQGFKGSGTKCLPVGQKSAATLPPLETKALIYVEVPEGHVEDQLVQFTVRGEVFEIAPPADCLPGEHFQVHLP